MLETCYMCVNVDTKRMKEDCDRLRRLYRCGHDIQAVINFHTSDPLVRKPGHVIENMTLDSISLVSHSLHPDWVADIHAPRLQAIKRDLKWHWVEMRRDFWNWVRWYFGSYIRGK